ncbi:MAG TPA: DegT/DnrJ/EryC1/StrS family aminotransferase [Chloroflexota bacterium]|nr:DegT/DnrJ/EryC1/StrS family aminotransferase [Chloroflexota bacterium]
MPALAINGGTPVRTAPWPAWPRPETAEHAAELVGEALRSGKWAGDGPMENEFGQKFAAFQRANHAVCVSSGTTALQTVFEAIGIGAGDEVIIPGLTWIATASAVLSTNGVPVFADASRETFCMDAKSAEALITPRTKAIVPVHLSGAMTDMDAIMDVARRHNLIVIEDAAHAHGSLWRCPDGEVRGAGAIGDAGCFSFQASKSLTSGEGGVILTRDKELADRCWAYRNVGRARNEGEEYVLGFNYRISEVQAAVLLAGLECLDGELETRDANGMYFNQQLGALPGIRPAKRDARVVRQAYYGYIFAFEPEVWEGVTRGRFVKALQAEGIRAAGGWGAPVYGMPYWNVKKERFPFAARYDPTSPDYQPPSCPYSDQFAYKEQVTLPHPVLLGSREDAADVVRAVEKVWEHRAELIEQPVAV